MDARNMSLSNEIQTLMNKANSSGLISIRLNNWQKVIEWKIEDESFFWKSDGSKFLESEPVAADFVLKCSKDVFLRVSEGKLPFFIGLWGTGDITFEGSFSDAYRLGYVFLSDKRKRQVIFISHCWLNINARFPEGCAFEGADVPVVKTLLDSGLGIIQMPCAEYECLGLEKWKYGEVITDELRACFRKTAAVVVKQIKDYLTLGFEVVGILGMNPSPSCGVGVAKGKGTMLGTNRDISEKQESGIFIEEIQKLLDEEGITGINIFGIRRYMTGEKDVDARIEALKTYIHI